VPVVPRGAGSGLSGGATAVDGGIVLSLERMRDITIDPAVRVAVAQPGTLTADVERAAAVHGLWYPPDPSSVEMCSIGGNAATNSGGLCCVKYGVTTDYVLGLQVVLADGTAVRLGGPRIKDAAGLALTKLFVGSEGTLGVITELTLRLLPAQPPMSTLVASFASVEAAAEAVLAITARLRPATLELMDNASINAVEDFASMGLDRSAGALLLVRSDAPGPVAGEEIAVVEATCRACGAAELVAPDETARARRAFGEIMELALSLGGTITGEHGVGRLKKDWLPAYLGEDVLALSRRIKDALDPAGILNPGAVLSGSCAITSAA
jgi:glycolate oxidase